MQTLHSASDGSTMLTDTQPLASNGDVTTRSDSLPNRPGQRRACST